MAAGLLTAGAGHPWETDVVAALDRPGAPLGVVRRCADIADVLATASTGQAAACLLAADLRRLDSESVQQLRALGVAVVAVHAARDQRAPVRLDRIGVSAAVPDDAGAEAIVAAVRRALTDGDPPISGPPQGVSGRAPDPDGVRWPDAGPARSGEPESERFLVGPNGLAEPDGYAEPDPLADIDGDALPAGRTGAGAPAAPAAPGGPDAPGSERPSPARPTGGAGGAVSVPARERGRPPGQVVAVWGPNGAPGRSTVAMGLADSAAADGRSVLLIDADVYGGVLASAFGLLDESPGLAGACRLAANGRLDERDLAALCWRVGEQFALLTGIARADRWPEVRPSAIPAVLAVARQLADLVVVDCAAVLETDEEISFDTMAPRRNGATLAVLDDADRVLAVGSADPPGMERLVRGLAELGAAVQAVSPRVVLNRVRRTAAPAGDLASAVRRFAGTDPVALLPEDRAACDRAWQQGVPLSAAAPRSSLTAELGALARTLMPARAGAGSRGETSAAAAARNPARAGMGGDHPGPMV